MLMILPLWPAVAGVCQWVLQTCVGELSRDTLMVWLTVPMWITTRMWLLLTYRKKQVNQTNEKGTETRVRLQPFDSSHYPIVDTKSN